MVTKLSILWPHTYLQICICVNLNWKTWSTHPALKRQQILLIHSGSFLAASTWVVNTGWAPRAPEIFKYLIRLEIQRGNTCPRLSCELIVSWDWWREQSYIASSKEQWWWILLPIAYISSPFQPWVVDLHLLLGWWTCFRFQLPHLAYYWFSYHHWCFSADHFPLQITYLFSKRFPEDTLSTKYLLSLPIFTGKKM